MHKTSLRQICSVILSIATLAILTFHFFQNNNPTNLLDMGEVANQATYKLSLENTDGSLDIIFNLPGNSPLARKLKGNRAYKPATRQKNNQTKSVQKETTLPKKKGKRTNYPVTLTSPYLINNPNICKTSGKLNFLVVVHTSTDHFQRRRLIRETWANKNIMKNGGSRIVFYFGLAKDRQTQTMIENESTVYGDTVQGNFKDTYHNLTHKGVLVYRWINEHCTNVEMILKVDDDMFVNIFSLLDYYLPLYRKKSRYISCHVRAKGTSPIVRGKSKWQVEVNQFKNMSHYPVTYCNGFFVLMTPDIVRELYRVSFLTPFFWVDDVYLYGLLPFKIGKVEFKSLGSNLTLNQDHGLKCLTGNKTCNLLASYSLKDGFMEQMWYASLKMFKNIAGKYIRKELLIS